MAILNPTRETIFNADPAPTNDELAIIDLLEKNLDKSYEIFYRPLLNGDSPNFILMKKGYGIIIIFISDLQISKFEISRNGNWKLNSKNEFVSPLKQALKCKENLYNLNIEELFNRHLKKPELVWPLVKCCLFFSKCTFSDLKQLTINSKSVFTDNYSKLVKDTIILGSNFLGHNNAKNISNYFDLAIPNQNFDTTLYDCFYRYFQWPFHKVEDGKKIIYNDDQQKLITSVQGQRRKIKGVAGCGKTLVLAKRAVNAHLRSKKRVLILTYNIALINYIKDRINDVRENFYWNNFYITNYHQFFKAEAIRYNLPCDDIKYWDDVNYFSEVAQKISTYDIVLIDEIQDYKQEWIDMITKYFISNNPELIVFGDEKQNIYEREMDVNKEPRIRTIPGAWNKSLSTSHRFSSKIGKLALAFQKAHFKDKYSFDELKTLSELDFANNIIEYHYLDTYDATYVYNLIFQFASKNKIHPSDICILSSKIESIRQIELFIRTKKKENTTLTFETQEDFDFCNGDKSKLERIRRVRKLHFKMNDGTIKISSVHSFKGWESHTLFFIIDNDDWGDERNNLELIYTGITRARVNLIIINVGKRQFDNFFVNNVEHVFSPASKMNSSSMHSDDLPF